MIVRLLVLALILAACAVQAAPAPFSRPTPAAQRAAEAEALALLKRDLSVQSLALVELRQQGNYWIATVLHGECRVLRRQYFIPLSRAPNRLAAIAEVRKRFIIAATHEPD